MSNASVDLGQRTLNNDTFVFFELCSKATRSGQQDFCCFAGTQFRLYAGNNPVSDIRQSQF